MKSADIARLRKLINLADKFADALGDAEARGLIGEWKTSGNLRDAVDEFHDFQCARLGAAEAA